MSPESPAAKPLVANEGIKAASHHLRGTIAADLTDTSTGAIKDENNQLTKFHGLYLQDDRDTRNIRKKEGEEKDFMFMLRVRLPGGRCSTKQWIVLADIPNPLPWPSLRLTPRQTFQFHGVLKSNLPPLIQQMHTVLL